MFKLLLVILRVALTVVSRLVLLAVCFMAGSYGRFSELDYGKSLPGWTQTQSYHSELGRDSVECRIYTYEDTDELRRKLEHSDTFMDVTSDATEYIAGFIEDFGERLEYEGSDIEYNLDRTCIDGDDYYYIENVKTHGGFDSERYYRYTVYYFDTQTMTLYYMHISI